jgi:drug/metabolite transporter (DMT)-like permease
LKLVYTFPIISTSIWGISISGAKILGGYGFSPIEVTFLRFGLSSLIFLPILLIFHLNKEKVIPQGKEWYPLIAIAITGVSLNNVIFYTGLNLTRATTASLLVSFNPLATMIFGVFLVKEVMTRRKWISVAIGVIGVYLILGSNVTLGQFHGNLLILTAVIIWGSSFSFSKISSQNGFSPVVITGWSQLIGTLILSPTSKSAVLKMFETSEIGIFWILYLGIISSVVGYIIHYQAINILGPGKVAPSTNIIPISGAISAFFILGDVIEGSPVLGAFLVIIAVLIVQTEKNPKLKEPLLLKTNEFQ